MKKVLTVMVALLFAASAYADLIELWSLNEGSGKNAASSGTVGTTLVHDIGGADATWVATPSGIGVDHPARFRGQANPVWENTISQFTIAAWVKLEAHEATDRQIFNGGDAGIAMGVDKWNRLCTGSNLTWAPYYETCGGSVPIGAWSFLVYTNTGLRDSGDTDASKIYIDGVKVAEGIGPWTGPTGDTYRYITLGTHQVSGQPYFNGMIDEVRLYDTVLDQAAIDALMAAGPVPIPEPSLMVLLVGALAMLRKK